MRRISRIVVFAIILIALALSYELLAQTVANMLWLLLFAFGVVSDLGGPEWLNWGLYLPTWLLYIAIVLAGIFWVRKAPHT